MSAEAWAFVLSVICGFLAVVLLGMRNALSAPFIIELFCDVLWWAAVLFMFALCMWQTVSFEVRFFQIVGLAAGAIFAHFTLARFITELTRTVFRVIFKILLTPCAFLYKIIVIPLVGLFGSNLRKVANDDSLER